MNEHDPQTESSLSSSMQRLDEFPGDLAEPQIAGAEAQERRALDDQPREDRMREMNDWANATGKLVEAKSKAHSANTQLVRELLEDRPFGQIGSMTAKERLHKEAVQLAGPILEFSDPSGKSYLQAMGNGNIMRSSSSQGGSLHHRMIRSPKNSGRDRTA